MTAPVREGLETETVRSAGDAVVTTDATGKITSWNPRAQSLFGHSPSTAVGQSLALIVPDAHRPRHAAGFRRAMTEGALQHRGVPARVEAQTADHGTVTLFMTLGLLRGTDGSVTGAVAVLRPEEPRAVEFVPAPPPAAPDQTPIQDTDRKAT